MLKRTICWECARTRGKNKCSWVEDFVPIEGWEVTEKSFSNGPKIIQSLDVHSCPQFIQYEKKRKFRQMRGRF